jgi:secreted PhoX family phosphatase
LAEAAERRSLRFNQITLDNQDRVLVAEGYDAKVLIRWGDPIFRSSPIFDPFNQSKTTQEQQFGYNCDYISYLPLSHDRSNNPQDVRKRRGEGDHDQGPFRPSFEQSGRAIIRKP